MPKELNWTTLVILTITSGVALGLILVLLQRLFGPLNPFIKGGIAGGVSVLIVLGLLILGKP